jgi:hypothetical protein
VSREASKGILHCARQAWWVLLPSSIEATGLKSTAISRIGRKDSQSNGSRDGINTVSMAEKERRPRNHRVAHERRDNAREGGGAAGMEGKRGKLVSPRRALPNAGVGEKTNKQTTGTPSHEALPSRSWNWLRVAACLNTEFFAAPLPPP